MFKNSVHLPELDGFVGKKKNIRIMLGGNYSLDWVL